MKQVIKLVSKSKVFAIIVLVACGLVCIPSGCKKEEKEANKLVGTWMFSEANVIYSIYGVSHNAKKEGMDLSMMEQQFRGLSFTFNKDKSLSGSQHGQSGPLGTYSVSDGKLYLDGELFSRYQLLGKKLDLVFTREEFRRWGGVPQNLAQYDDIEAILSFKKVD